jgi:hypothetical protein
MTGARTLSCCIIGRNLLLALAATVAGPDDFEEPRFGVRRIRRHATLCDVFAAIDPELFKACFLSWVDEGRDPSSPELIANR